MKTYRENHDGTFTYKGSRIPPAGANRQRQQMLAELKAGAAEVLPFDPEAAAADQADTNATTEARRYLANTDWYIVRKGERGVDVPADITQKRLAAIDILNTIE